MAVPTLPMANLVVTKTRRVFGFFQEMFDVIARAGNGDQCIEVGMCRRIG